MSDENTLLIAIPTYKRSEDVGELLRAIYFVSAYRNVTVIIFDSSTDDKTLRIVDKNGKEVVRNTGEMSASELTVMINRVLDRD